MQGKPEAADIAWLKGELGARIAASVVGTPYGVDLLVALACQKTGESWPLLDRAMRWPAWQLAHRQPFEGLTSECQFDTLMS